ncbi:MAG: trehalose-phosphatase [Methanobacterium sp.]|nr:trehalose-phosphatase [Methanobacterium sp.]
MSKYLFDNLNYLKTFKNDSSTAIVTDVDGTISEIVPTPDEAMVTESMQNALIKLYEKFQLVAVVSGRSVLNAREMVGVEGLLYVGNHGMEFLKNNHLSMDPQVEKYLPQIKKTGKKIKEGDLSRINGLIFEDKGICYSIHYRCSHSPENVREKILNTLQKDPECKNLNISEGRRLVELKPPVNCDKGTILNGIIDQYNLKKIIYLGDDITDSDAFNKLKELENEGKIEGAGILVRSSEIPSYVKKHSSFFVNDVDEVLKFFQWLLN